MLESLLIKGGGARDALRAIIEGDLPARGLAHVVSVKAIAHSLDAKWEQKREAVWEFVHRTLQRRAAGVMCVQLNEVDFLLAFPTAEPAAAAARCIDVLAEVLQHFLGRSDRVQQWVRAISSVEAGRIGSENADAPAAAAESGRSLEHARGAGAPALTPSRAVLGSQEPLPGWTPFSNSNDPDFIEWTTTSGETQRMAMQLHPVWSLQHCAVSSFRLDRGFNPVSLGHGVDRERLDLAVLDYATGPAALGFLQQGTFLHLPVALSTLLLQRTRLRYLHRLQSARHTFRQRVLLELEGVDRGVVESRLQEVVHLMRPNFRLILASSAGLPLRGSTLRSVGVPGAVIDLAAIGEPMTRSTLLTQIARSRRESPIVVVHGLYEGEIDDGSLRAAGASHVSSRPLGRANDPAGSERSRATAAEAAELRRIAKLIQFEKRGS